ncbi:hypothetical protein OF83DRAFT_869944 [Amylostereum chailletii]|nr:hypothetical protein OF83DRAFT_869944 [Amylostereum chailletii]
MSRIHTPRTSHKLDGRTPYASAYKTPSSHSKLHPRAVPRLLRAPVLDSSLRMFNPKSGARNLHDSFINSGAEDHLGQDDSSDGGESSDDSGGNSDSQGWGEEETLYDMVQPGTASKGEDSTASTLVNGLSPAFARASDATRQTFIDALRPAMHRLREEIPPMNDKMDRQCAQSMKEMRDACALFEQMDLDAGEDKGKEADANKRFKDIFTEMQNRYKKRDEIEARRRALVQEKMEHLRARVHALPDDMEHLIDKVFKKAKELDKADAMSTQAQKRKLQDLLHKA